MNRARPLHPFWLGVASILLSWLIVPALMAQEEADEAPVKTRQRIVVDLETWIAQPYGTDFEAARITDPLDPLSTRSLQISHGTEDKVRYGLKVGLGQAGSLSGSYYVHDTFSRLSAFSPGVPIFGESLLRHPHAGYANDGLADAFASDATTNLRDWNLAFRRQAFQSERAAGEWYVGWRRVGYDQRLESTYYTTLPDLPTLLPPFADCCPNLDPEPDLATVSSRYEGRGGMVGFDATLPLWKDKIIAEGGVSVSLLRGKINPAYRGKTSVYVLGGEILQVDDVDGTYVEFGEIVDGDQNPCYPSNVDPDGNPTTPFEKCTAKADLIVQPDSVYALGGDNLSRDGSVVEMNIGFRWRAHRKVEVHAGYRNTRYDGVAVELRPTVTTENLGLDGVSVLSLSGVEEVERSVGYEGFYFGVRLVLY